MNKGYTCNPYPHWIMVVHIFRVVFITTAISILMIFLAVYALYRPYGEDISGAEISRLPVLLISLVFLSIITFLIERTLEQRQENAPQKELIVEEEYFIYRTRKGEEHLINWPQVRSLKIVTMKMGYKFIVQTETIKFSLYSYEIDPLPITFQEQWEQATEEWRALRSLSKDYKRGELNQSEYRKNKIQFTRQMLRQRSKNFFDLLSIFKEKCPEADWKKDLVAASVFKKYNLLEEKQ